MKKNILISVFDMEIGGIERSLINMLESFDYENFNIDLLVFNHQGDFMKLIPTQVNLLPEINKLTVFRRPIIECLKEGHYTTSIIRLISKPVASVLSRLKGLRDGSGYIQMQLALKYSSYFIPKLSKKYDVAISYAWPHDIVLRNVEARKKIAWIHTDYSKLEVDNHMDLKLWEKFDSIASISEACTTAFLTKYPGLKHKIVLIENITSPHLIKKLATDDCDSHIKVENSFTIVSVGRLSYVKGFDLAIDALKLLHNRGYKNIKWYVVGYGGHETELREHIKKNDLDESFILLGKKTNPYPYIKMCDLYVQPSRYEGKAVTVTEAMILSKPIVITNYPTASSQVSHEVDGIICSLSAEGLAKEIEKLYNNEDLRNRLVSNISNKDYSNSYELAKLYQITG